jgi:aquaporin Z
MQMTTIVRKAAAEALGTLWLVFAGVGSAVLAGPYIGVLGVSLAFGLTILTAWYALGPISGANLNPAVSTGMLAAGRLKFADFVVYVVAQLAGALVGTVIVVCIARGSPGYVLSPSALAANGYGMHSPGGFDLASCLLAECVLSFFFVLVVLGATSWRAPAAFAGIAIGFALAAVHLIGIRITNMSVNPARSTGPAIIAGRWALAQLWLFWVAPLFGGAIAGLTTRLLRIDRAAPAPLEEPVEPVVRRPVVTTSPR